MAGDNPPRTTSGPARSNQRASYSFESARRPRSLTCTFSSPEPTGFSPGPSSRIWTPPATRSLPSPAARRHRRASRPMSCATWRTDESPRLVPGECEKPAHDRANLGCGGRRVLASRHGRAKPWPNTRPTERAWSRATLHAAGVVALEVERMAATVTDGSPRFVWTDTRPDPRIYARVILAAVFQRRRGGRRCHGHRHDQSDPRPARSDSRRIRRVCHQRRRQQSARSHPRSRCGPGFPASPPKTTAAAGAPTTSGLDPGTASPSLSTSPAASPAATFPCATSRPRTSPSDS